MIVVFSDSLSIDGVNKTPHHFTSKLYLLPHLRGAMSGTGYGHFIADWHKTILTGMLAMDMVHLDIFTTEALREIWSNLKINTGTSTIYHFCYSEKDGKYKTFAYRSENDFESESLQYGIAVKPQIDTNGLLPQKGEPLENMVDIFVRLISNQRDHDNATPADKRVGIGGEIQMLIMQNGSYHMQTIHQFADYEETYLEMTKHLPST